jgi:hypothetical protein
MGQAEYVGAGGVESPSVSGADVGTIAVMDRDRRLTGFLRGQTDNPKAPSGFELSNAWRVCIVLSTTIGQFY